MPSFAAAGWVEEDGVWYYYDSDGVIVRNTWVMVVNEDQDDDDDPAKYNYYTICSPTVKPISRLATASARRLSTAKCYW